MKKKIHWLRVVLFAGYCLFIVWETILKRLPTDSHKVEWRLFWSYRLLFSGGKHGIRVVIQNLQNIVFFIPFGLLIPEKKWWVTGLSALCLSIMVEVAQFIGGYGLAELDDVICNTLGALAGFWIVRCFKRRYFKQES